jgi:hypothetical protein
MGTNTRDRGGGEIVVRNASRRAKRLVLYPTGTILRLEYDDAFEVRGRGPGPGRLTVEHAHDAIVVTAWPGAILSARRISGLVDDETRATRSPPSLGLGHHLRQEPFADEEDPDDEPAR